MKKFKAGEITLFDERLNEIFTNDFKSFVNADNEEVNKEDLQEWAEWLNSPWTYSTKSYTIMHNCNHGVTRPDEEYPWLCEYTAVGYEGVTTSIFGYGDSEITALENCIKNFELIQAKYNPDNVSI